MKMFCLAVTIGESEAKTIFIYRELREIRQRKKISVHFLNTLSC
jgi:hypothetical protein